MSLIQGLSFLLRCAAGGPGGSSGSLRSIILPGALTWMSCVWSFQLLGLGPRGGGGGS